MDLVPDPILPEKYLGYSWGNMGPLEWQLEVQKNDDDENNKNKIIIIINVKIYCISFNTT